MLDIIVFIIVLSVLIVVHEFGHFLVARRSGVKVEKFAIGFGKELLTIKGKETDFSVCLFPLGGYVKLAGENRTEAKGLPNEFFSKPVLTRIKIVFAGPLFNYLLAFVMFWLIAMLGFPHDNYVAKVQAGYPAAESGIKENDKIIEVDGKAVSTWYELSSIIRKINDKVRVKIERDGKIMAFDIPVKKEQASDESGKMKEVSRIGIERKVKIIRYNFFHALAKAVSFLAEFTVLTVKGIIFLIIGSIPAKEIAGPLGIYQVTSDAVKIGISAVLYLMAILNVNLAIVNLFPIPVLDGGHISLFVLEGLRKKPLSEKTENRITQAGLTFIALLFIFLMYNDLTRMVERATRKKKATAVQEQQIPRQEVESRE